MAGHHSCSPSCLFIVLHFHQWFNFVWGWVDAMLLLRTWAGGTLWVLFWGVLGGLQGLIAMDVCRLLGWHPPLQTQTTSLSFITLRSAGRPKGFPLRTTCLLDSMFCHALPVLESSWSFICVGFKPPGIICFAPGDSEVWPSMSCRRWCYALGQAPWPLRRAQGCPG